MDVETWKLELEEVRRVRLGLKKRACEAASGMAAAFYPEMQETAGAGQL